MIDKLDLRVPRHTPFSPSFGRLYSELQALPRSPFYPSKFYEFTGDLREYGFNARLSLYCQMDKAGNHKLELIDVGQMRRTDVLREVAAIFDVRLDTLGVMRVDFAVDVSGVPVQWFRETVYAQQKRFRAAVTDEPFHAEMGCGGIQTLYFGKRPNLIRIYDKLAEYRHQHRITMRRTGFESAFEAAYPDAAAHSILTRVERQIGGRMPAEFESLSKIFESGFNPKPFAKLKLIDHAIPFESDSKMPFETYCTGQYMRSIAANGGMQAVNDFLSKRANGNASWARKKYMPFLVSATSRGLTGESLQARFSASLSRQMAG